MGALLCGLYVFVPPFAGSGPVVNLLGLSPVIAIIVGVRRYRPASPGPWCCFAVGLVLFWLGDVYTYSYRSCSAGRCRSPRSGTPRTSSSTPR